MAPPTGATYQYSDRQKLYRVVEQPPRREVWDVEGLPHDDLSGDERDAEKVYLPAAVVSEESGYADTEADPGNDE